MAQHVTWRFACGGLLLALAPDGSAQTELISKSSSGGATGAAMSLAPAISPNGRWVAFSSEAQDLVAGVQDANFAADIYLADRVTGAIERISMDEQGGDPDSTSWSPRLSRNARQVVFLSDATDLVPGDTNGATDVFVRDREARTTTRVSVGPAGEQALLSSLEPAISGDGRFVAFMSAAGNLLPDGLDANGKPDVFLHDRQTRLTTRVSVGLFGEEANGESRAPSLSLNGRYVAFESKASNIVEYDTNNAYDIFRHDLLTGRTERMSLGFGGFQANSSSLAPSLSADGRRVAFFSAATNLVADDANGTDDVFVLDTRTGIMLRASEDAQGVDGNDSSNSPSLSPDGRFVGFDSEATNLAPVPAGSPFVPRRVFLKDLLTGAILDAGVAPDGSAGDGVGSVPSVGRFGRTVAFQSGSTNLVPLQDGNDGWDVFVHEP